MFKPVYHCDVCQVQKGETNHWLAVRITKDCGQIYPRMETRAFDDGTANDEHICGAACLSKRVSSFVESLHQTMQSVKDDDAVAA